MAFTTLSAQLVREHEHPEHDDPKCAPALEPVHVVHLHSEPVNSAWGAGLSCQLLACADSCALARQRVLPHQCRARQGVSRSCVRARRLRAAAILALKLCAWGAADRLPAGRRRCQGAPPACTSVQRTSLAAPGLSKQRACGADRAPVRRGRHPADGAGRPPDKRGLPVEQLCAHPLRLPAVMSDTACTL
jgi:hypothetical protein